MSKNNTYYLACFDIDYEGIDGNKMRLFETEVEAYIFIDLQEKDSMGEWIVIKLNLDNIVYNIADPVKVTKTLFKINGIDENPIGNTYMHKILDNIIFDHTDRFGDPPKALYLTRDQLRQVEYDVSVSINKFMHSKPIDKAKRSYKGIPVVVL